MQQNFILILLMYTAIHRSKADINNNTDEKYLGDTPSSQDKIFLFPGDNRYEGPYSPDISNVIEDDPTGDSINFYLRILTAISCFGGLIIALSVYILYRKDKIKRRNASQNNT